MFQVQKVDVKVGILKDEVVKLADHLPASLESLKIPAPVREVDESVDRLMDLLERKDESQPKLTRSLLGPWTALRHHGGGLWRMLAML